MSVITLKGTRREAHGKGGARKARAAGQIPGIVYGHGETPVAVAVSALEFTTAMRGHKGGNPIVSLEVGGDAVTALVRDVQYDPLSHAILHLDFQHISLTEQIEVQVPVHATGTPAGVKDGGGLLEIITRHLMVRCLPTAIPASIDVDVTPLVIGQSIHVRDLPKQAFEIVTDADTTLAVVVAPIVEEVAPAEVPVEAAAAEPEVVGAKGKKEEAPEAAEKEGKESKESKEPRKEKK